MTHQTNEELREKLDRKFNKYFEHYEDVEQSHIDKMVNEIMSLIPQPEQLEVYLYSQYGSGRGNVSWTEVRYKPKDHRMSVLIEEFYGEYDDLGRKKAKQLALDFCKRFNLKVVNESDKDGLK